MENETSNYYEILQVSPSADQEIIERIFRLLAKRYHPDNKHTGNDKTFRVLAEAYRVLSDPGKRAAYDGNHNGNGTPRNNFRFNLSESRDSAAEKKIIQAILSVFYAARKQNAMRPGVGVIELERLVGLPEKELEFHLWYIKEKGWIQRLETGEFAITAKGVDTIIGNNAELREDRLLPFAINFS